MSDSLALLQYGMNPLNTRFNDIEGRTAFIVMPLDENPNLLVRLTREAQWAQQHPEIMGPSASYFYFGPARSPGYLVYGNGPTNPMANSCRQKKEGSASRYFHAQNGRELKWRVSPRRMECVDGRNTIAIWETATPADDFDARLILKQSALPLVTELLTTLSLNRMAHTLDW